MEWEEAKLTLWGSSSGREAELSGLFLSLLLFRNWTADRVSREKNTFLIASIPYVIVEFICVLGLKYKSFLDINRHSI